MEDGIDFGHPSNPSGLEKRLLVFNGDFVETNLQWAHGKASPVFFIGIDQADAAKTLTVLETKIPQLRARVTAAEKAVSQAEKSFSTFKRDRAKLVAPRLHQGNRKYEAPQLTKDFEDWAALKISLVSDDELKAAEDTRRLEEPMPKIGTVSFDTSSICKAYQFIREICEQTLSTVALEEVQQHPDMLLWLKKGHEFHEQQHLNNCLLCGNTFSEKRLAQLKGALDNQIDEFVSRLAKTADRLNVVRTELSELETSAPSIDAFSIQLQPVFKDCKGAFLSTIETSKKHTDLLEEVLSAKRERPASPADTSHLPSQSEVENAAAKMGESLEKLNNIINQHNQTVSEFEKHREEAGIVIRQHYIAECRDDFAAHIKSLDDSVGAEKTAREELEKTNVKAETLRQKIRTHGPAAEVINQLIASYLGHDELTIVPIDEGYELHRFGKAIQGLPSEGEKTAIAISYFLSRVESDGRSLEDLIVVIDDPVSSLDTRALNYACSLIRSRLSNTCQLIILTHNQQCLNEFRKAWKNKARPPDGKDPTATFLFIDVVVPEGASKRVSSLVKMSKLLREYDSEYHFLFSRVLQFYEAGDDFSEYGYMMPNVLRRVLDIFLAFKCPGNSGLPGKIDEICRHYPDLDKDRMNALERLAQVESHSDNLDDLISFSSMTLEETKAATSALLEMMEKVDEKHTTALKRACR
ncbi:AAA family ATPase [Roseibium sp. FZY0029]|uniref:AAA family ATPase n=1 Tax=Roseibium sp. FZY0029 TaxID=3116647 RepID=UPI002EC9B415|nr:AAA family ATPase [Roseibium sp. FZY0029]